MHLPRQFLNKRSFSVYKMETQRFEQVMILKVDWQNLAVHSMQWGDSSSTDLVM